MSIALSFLEEDGQATFERASVAVLPVPFGATVCYGRGTEMGPRAILEASRQLELYDERMGIEPYRCGIWTDAMLEVTPDTPTEDVVRAVAGRFGELMDSGKWVVMLGGEHSITPGGVRAAASRHDGLQVLQLDAHADLRESYEGDHWNHACAMARCLELAPVRAVGIRSYSADERERIAAGISGYSMNHASSMITDGWIDTALEGLQGAPVYLTIDVDYFDPAVIPATGTPEPGGGEWWPTLDLLSELFKRAKVVACDVVELAPQTGLHYADFTVARLVYKLIGYACSGELDTTSAG
jgi:agmatinase